MYRVGIDLGGTKIEGVLLDASYGVLEQLRIPTPRTYEGILGAVYDIVAGLDPGGPCTVGVGAPGTSDPDGLIKNSNTRCLTGRPLQHDLQQTLGVPVRTANDADCFVAAEAVCGAAAGYDVVFGVIMGTGVGGGVFADGRVWPGRMGMAGEWGHGILHPEGHTCWCGRRGCVETYLSGPALERRWTDAGGIPLAVPDILLERPHGYAAWQAGVVRDFGLALSGVIQILDPDAIVLGGGLSNMPFLYREGVSEVYGMVMGGRTPILRNKLGDSAGVVGAALLWESRTIFKRHIERTDYDLGV